MLVLTVTAAAGATLAFAATPASAATVSTTTLENQVTTLVNQERAKVGCAALRTDTRLHNAALAHSKDMAATGNFSHTGSDGSTFVTREQAAGYTAPGGGENIAWGWRTATDVMNAWMNSAPHKANILNCSFKAGGVGVARKTDGTPYWTQDFGTV